MIMVSGLEPGGVAGCPVRSGPCGRSGACVGGAAVNERDLASGGPVRDALQHRVELPGHAPVRRVERRGPG